MNRARLTAVDEARWCLAQLPVILPAIILPLSVM